MRPARTLGGTLRRVWAPGSVLVGALLWWPAGFWGLESWPQVPLRAITGDTLLFGATVAAATVALLVRAPWPRLAVVVAWSALGWTSSSPSAATYPDEHEVLVLLLVAGAAAGTFVGSLGRRSLLGVATVLALVAGLSPATWPHGLVLAVALALPFAVASWTAVAPTLLAVARVLLAWLVAGVLVRSAGAGWDVLHPRMDVGSKRGELRLVAEAAWEHAATSWWQDVRSLLSDTVPWFWVALVLAVLVAAARALTGQLRRPGPAPEGDSVTSGGRRR